MSTSPSDASGNQQVPGHLQSSSQLPLSQPQHWRAPTQLQPRWCSNQNEPPRKCVLSTVNELAGTAVQASAARMPIKKPVKRILQHGNRVPHGCALGRSNCDNYHPRTCATSMSKGIYFNVDCKLSNVAGT